MRSLRLLLPAAAVAVTLGAAPAALADSLVLVSDTGAAPTDPPFTPAFKGMSQDGARVFFETNESLLPSDTDTSTDVYARNANGTFSHISDGPNPGTDPNVTAVFRTASPDGTRVFFATTEALAGTDTDTASDGYARNADGSLTHLTDGPNAGTDPNINSFLFVDDHPAGGRVFFGTDENMLPADTDPVQIATGEPARDIYARETNGDLTLISDDTPAGTTDGPGNADFEASSEDGNRVVFQTTDALAGSDGDSATDIYTSNPDGSLSHVSDGVGGDGAAGVLFRAASDDASRVFFQTSEALSAQDTDGSTDVYAHNADGSLALVSDVTPSGSDASVNANFEGSSANGDRAFFTTQESLIASDQDSAKDTYARSADGSLTAISDGPGPDLSEDAFFDDVSADGTRVLFDHTEPLAASDTDAKEDAYVRAGDGSLTHVSDGLGSDTSIDAFGDRISGDGRLAAFDTEDALLPSDTDAATDLYARDAEGGLRQISDGTDSDSPDGAVLEAIAADGTTVIFRTGEQLLPEDTDTAPDLYALVGIDPGHLPPPAPPPGPGPGPGPTGGAPPTQAPAGPDRTGPQLRTLALSSTRFAPVTALPSIAKTRGTTIGYALSEPASVRFTIARESTGRRVGRSCAVPRRSNRSRPRCLRLIPLRGSFTHPGADGANRFRFTGWLTGRPLRPGSYRLTATARDRAGNRGTPVTRRFRIIR